MVSANIAMRNCANRAFVLIVCALGFLVLQNWSAQAARPETVRYGSQQLDIYRMASSDRKRPVVIFVHGGAWKRGSRRNVGSKPSFFAARGNVFVSVGYTLYPGADVGTQARQIGEAVRWVRSNIGQYGGQGSRIFLMGHSAGCHLASLAVMSGIAGGVRGLICLDTRAYNLNRLVEWHGGALPRVYSPFSRKVNWKRWSPSTYLGRRKLPPMLIAWSNGRGRALLSREFVRSLRGVGSQVMTFDGARQYSHRSINTSVGSESGGITGAIDKFLKRFGG